MLHAGLSYICKKNHRQGAVNIMACSDLYRQSRMRHLQIPHNQNYADRIRRVTEIKTIIANVLFSLKLIQLFII